MKLKLIYLICMILCVFLTFSTVNAADLNDSSLNSVVNDSQSESSFTNLNEDISNNIVKINEDEDCVESMNELSNLNDDLTEYSYFKSGLSSINSDENSLKSTLSPNGNTFSSIQEAINTAKSGDTISLNGKTYSGNGTIVVINKPLTINGGQGSQKATLDAKKLSGIFRVTAANVKLTNCNFINTNNKAVIFINDNGSIRNCDFKDNYADVKKVIEGSKTPSIVIDDAGYLITNQFMRKHSNTGGGNAVFSLYNDIADSFWNLTEQIKKLPNNKIVYILMHEDKNDFGDIKPKTIGKLIDEKVCLEGLFSIVLRAKKVDKNYYFFTQATDGDVAKSPIGMFDELYIENDLKVVDDKIREFYGIANKEEK